MKVEYENFGIGNNYGDKIILNVNLLKPEYKELHDQILRHEFKHIGTRTKQDLIADFGESHINNIKLIKFIIKNPKSLTQFLPFYWHKDYGFVYDFSYIITYLIGIIIILIASFGIYWLLH